MRKMKFQQVRGGKYFNPHNVANLQGVDMFQAFFNTVKAIDGKIYLNLNPSVKFFQNEALNDTFYNMGDPRRIAEEFTNRSVMTYYNNRVYTITEIDFKKDPSHKFHLTSKTLRVI